MSIFGIPPDPPEYDEEEDHPTVECKHCGVSGLHWEDVDGKWVLMGGNYKVHVCDPARLAKIVANDFEDLSK